MMIRGVSRSKAEAKYVPALVGSVAEDAVFESELVSVEAVSYTHLSLSLKIRGPRYLLLLIF